MKKNQERRLHRKNAKIVKEGGTPMQLNRPVKPDTTVRLFYSFFVCIVLKLVQRRCGHCGQMGHMKTNRKCPRWAEFNSGTPAMPTPAGSATSPPATSPSANSVSFSPTFPSAGPSSFPTGGSSLRVPNPMMSHGPSPLAMSPPMTAMDEDDDDDDDDDDVPETPSGPKLKFMFRKS